MTEISHKKMDYFLTITDRFKNPNDFILAVVLDSKGKPKKELKIQSISDYQDLEDRLICIFSNLEKLWKLGMVFNHPELSNKEINKHKIDQNHLINCVLQHLNNK